MKHKHIEPKPTLYAGVAFRSRLEARWAVFFDNVSNILTWRYEPCTWTLPGKGWTYTPDFELRLFLDGTLDTIYIEVKPISPTKEYLDLLDKVCCNKVLCLFVSSLYPDNGVMSFKCSLRGKRRAAVNLSAMFMRFNEAIQAACNYRFDLET